MGSMLSDVFQDVRFGLRLLRRSPVFTTVAVSSLALGIGGAAAVFSLLNAIVLRNLPVAEPDRLFVRQGAWIIAAGLVLGVLTTLATGRLIESQLHMVTPRDPVALIVAVSAFALAGLLAVWWPARRAAATDPAIALKSE